MLTFPMYDRDAREVWEIPEVRTFFQKLSTLAPHFPYFLVTKPEAGQLYLWILCQVDVQKRSAGVEIDLTAVSRYLKTLEASLKRFCIQVREDHESVMSE